MLTENRQFQRFDINTILQFQGAYGSDESFIGITRNFSWKGFSLETQSLAFQPANNLKATLKHPRKDESIALKGRVVWKRNDNKFACVMGVELIDMDLDTRLRMLEILSIIGNIPIDAFVSWNYVQEKSEEEEATVYDSEYIEAQKIKQVSDTPTEDDLNAALTGIEVPGQTPDVHEEAFAEEPAAEAMLHEEREDALSDKATEQEYEEDIIVPKNIMVRKRKLLYASIIGVVAIMFIYIFWDGSREVAKKTAPVSKKSASTNDLLKPILPGGDARTGGVIGTVVSPIVPPVARQGKNTKDVADTSLNMRRSQTGIQTVDSGAYYIQIGAWTDSDNASRMLVKVKKYYPDAYMIVEGRFIKVKVPGIKNETQGNRILKDIKNKFNVTPLLVSNK